MNKLTGNLIATDHRFGLVVSRFNHFITDKLLEGAVDVLERHGANPKNITISHCPGAYEIPLVAQKMAQTKQFDAIICLGAVIRGATSHYDLVASQSAQIGNVSLQTGIPILFGVITTETIEQAIERAGTKAGNKGAEAAVSAIEMVNLLKEIETLAAATKP